MLTMSMTIHNIFFISFLLWVVKSLKWVALIEQSYALRTHILFESLADILGSDALQAVAVVVEIFQTLAVLQEGGEDVLPFCRCVIRERLALGNEELHLQFVEFSLADSAGLQLFDDSV